MFEVILKYLPILIVLVPFLGWVDKKKRYFHNSKFYSERAQLLKTYEDESRRLNITEHERNAFAQAYVASEKIGFKDIEIVKIRYPNQLYHILQQIIKVRGFLSIKVSEGQSYYQSKFSLKYAWCRYIWIAFYYLSSILVLTFNEYALACLSFFDFKPILVSELRLLIWQIFLILCALTVIATAILAYIKNQVLIDLMDDKKLFIGSQDKILQNDNVTENEILI